MVAADACAMAWWQRTGIQNETVDESFAQSPPMRACGGAVMSRAFKQHSLAPAETWMQNLIAFASSPTSGFLTGILTSDSSSSLSSCECTSVRSTLSAPTLYAFKKLRRYLL